MATIFISYSHKDEDLRNEIEAALSPLRRQGLIEVWHDRRITAGSDFANEIDHNLEEADIILLLVSSYFIDSDYAYGIEVQRALEREKEGSARVIPIILRPTDWHGLPFSRLQALPPDGKPVSSHPDMHEALSQISKGLRQVIEEEAKKTGTAQPAQPRGDQQSESVEVGTDRREAGPRSSNLRVRRDFTDREREEFLKSSFQYIATFFENSLAELEERNPGTATELERVTSRRFTAAIFQEGKLVSECTIWLGSPGSFGNGIGYLSQRTEDENSYNEWIAVENDGYTQYLRVTMGSFHGQDPEEKLTPEGASEYLWNRVIEHLQ